MIGGVLWPRVALALITYSTHDTQLQRQALNNANYYVHFSFISLILMCLCAVWRTQYMQRFTDNVLTQEIVFICLLR